MEKIESFLDFISKIKKFIQTYKWATTLKNYGDLGTVNVPLTRCRYFFPISLLFAILMGAVLLASLNLNVLDLHRSRTGYDGEDLLVPQVVQDLTAAIPHLSLHDFGPTKQTVTIVATFVVSTIATISLAFLAAIKKSPDADLRQRQIFSTFIISAGLVRFGMVSIAFLPISSLIYHFGYRPTYHPYLSIFLLILSFAATWGWLFSIGIKRSRTSAGLTLDGEFALSVSALAPILAIVILLFSSPLIDDWFSPSVTIVTSSSCGAPGNGVCILTIEPKDIDGSVWLDDVEFNRIELVYDDEKNIVGPPHTLYVSASLRLIQSPDTPFPVAVQDEETQGAIGWLKFNCPTSIPFDQHRKMVVKGYHGFAYPRVRHDVDPAQREQLSVKLASTFDIALIFRNSTKECTFFP